MESAVNTPSPFEIVKKAYHRQSSLYGHEVSWIRKLFAAGPDAVISESDQRCLVFIGKRLGMLPTTPEERASIAKEKAGAWKSRRIPKWPSRRKR